ncbi:PREDICTED: protein LYK5 [Theobroma cacao]|uniref:Protein LYK5 n=1 Tax=Theobroma cacao TaxID=3641 RepID=A0AB32V5J9_THECC|nr:PREDICTED: protein LYK5 [Theobroma cacao]
MEKKLKPWPTFHVLALLLLLFLSLHCGSTQGQQAYLNNDQLECGDKSKDNNITRGFLCNGVKQSCQSYLTFRAEPPYNSAVTIAYLLGAQPDLISSLRINNLSSDVSAIPANSLVFFPLNCSCAGSYYQHNVTYTIKEDTETYFTMANDTYQGLTTCQAMKAQNSIGIMDLKVGDKLQVPLRCACPTLDQTYAGAKYLLTYIAGWEDSISSIAETFGVDDQSVLDANKLIEDMIYPFTPVLVPLAREPTMIVPPQASPSPPPPSQITITPTRKSKSSHKWVFVGIGIAAGLLFLFSLSGLLFCFYKHPSLKAEPEASAPPEPKPLSDSIDYSDKSWFVSIHGGTYEVESLTPYTFKDLEAATGNFSESNIIKGSIYRGQFQGDDAAVKVIKGDVSVEMNLLKKINHNNIVRLSGFCVHEGNTYLVYEHVEKGSLDDWLQTSKYQTSFSLSWKQRVQIAYNVADALNYLHNYINPPCIHRNLKTSSILLDGNFRAKVANFGLARSVENEGDLQLTTHVVGTQGYMAPEHFENGVITPKLDVFAFGVVLLELLSGRKAAEKNAGGEELLSASIKGVLEGVNVAEKLQNFIDPTLRHEYPLDLAFSMAQLARNCVAYDLNARPSMAEVLITVTKICSSSLHWCPSDEFQSLSSAKLATY